MENCEALKTQLILKRHILNEGLKSILNNKTNLKVVTFFFIIRKKNVNFFLIIRIK